jgi:protein TonB
MIGRRILNDRFTVSIMLAMGVHVAVLLGVSFALDFNPLKKAAETLDVVLVNFRSQDAPEEADFLAQSSQQGGGDAPDVGRPAQSMSSAVPSEGEGEMPVSSEMQQPVESQDAREQVTSVNEDARPVQQITRVEQPEPEFPSAAELMRQRMRIAELREMLQDNEEAQSRLKRRRFISANTREYEFASYMQAWVAKVERVGNLNYPPEVKRRKLVGDLIMTVGISQDGSVESINIRRSSGMPELDQAAQRIVMLAAPYAPLPTNISSKVDVLHITRTWKFSTGYGFQ